MLLREYSRFCEQLDIATLGDPRHPDADMLRALLGTGALSASGGHDVDGAPLLTVTMSAVNSVVSGAEHSVSRADMIRYEHYCSMHAMTLPRANDLGVTVLVMTGGGSVGSFYNAFFGLSDDSSGSSLQVDAPEKGRVFGLLVKQVHKDPCCEFLM